MDAHLFQLVKQAGLAEHPVEPVPGLEVGEVHVGDEPLEPGGLHHPGVVELLDGHAAVGVHLGGTLHVGGLVDHHRGQLLELLGSPLHQLPGALVGGGGKTTLMYNLAAHCARKGWRVLAATTTHIMQPPGGVWAQTDAELFRLWKCGSYAVAGTAAHGGKLTAPPQAQLERWMTLADIVLIEADGAKRMPCKAPAAHEPVLLPQCDTVLAVAGLSALRHPLREVCFRAELAAELLCVPQDAQLTPELLANLLASEAGGRKAVGDRSFYVVLNQVDTKEQAALARQVADILKKIYRISCATSHFEKGERA